MDSRQQDLHTVAPLDGLLTLAVNGFNLVSASISPVDAVVGGRVVPPSTSLQAGMLSIPA